MPRSHPASHPLARRHGRALPLTLVVVAGIAPATAAADGFKLGEARLHPSFETETHHVVNPGFQADDHDRGNDVYLVARPAARLELASERLELRLLGDLEYRDYLGLEREETENLSSFAGHLGAEVSVNEGAALSFFARELFSRQADAANQTASHRLLHSTNDLALGLEYRPGGGALVVSAEYGLWYDRYDRHQAGVVTPAALDNLSHRPALEARWKFLPRTALFVEAEGHLARYPGPAYVDAAGAAAASPPVSLLLAHAGAVGAVTSKINALVKVGYGDTFLEDDNYRSIVGQAELAFLASHASRLRAGYLRTVMPTSFFKYLGLDRVYLDYRHQLLGATTVALELEYTHLRYGLTVLAPTGRRSDDWLVAALTLEHRLREWLTVSLVERLDWRESEWVSPAGGRVGYLHNDFFLRMTLDVDEVTALVAQ